MKQMGRAHRHYYRIVAIDHRQPRDGKVIEELGSYDPHHPDEGQQVSLLPSRIKYWQSVGAKPSHNCQVIINKYLQKFEEIEAKQSEPAPASAAEETAEASAEAN